MMQKFRSVKEMTNLVRSTQGRTGWYKLTNQAGVAEVMIYDSIGYYGITASDFVSELKGLDVAEIAVHINSPGGEVFDGIAIHNALRSHPANVRVNIDSLAASIASVIAMAGDEIIMERNAQMMIHDGYGAIGGNAADLREMADLLDKTSDTIAGIYAERTGKDASYWRGLMKAETWYTAEEAVAAGLADRFPPARNTTDNQVTIPVYNLSPGDFRLAVKEATR